MSLLERFQAMQDNLSRLIGIDDNDFNTSGFSRAEAMGNVRSLQDALGNLLGNSSASSSLSGSVGKGGDNNAEDVRLVQQLLNQKASAGLAVDGLYGPNTLAAIEAYQESIFNGWSDGLVEPGGRTIQSLTQGSNTAPTTGSDTNPSTGDGLSGSVGQGGDNNADDARRVQELLNGKGAQIGVDGQVGPQTIGAIRSFQSANGIPADGLIEPGRNTWRQLTGSGNSISSSSGGTSTDQPQPARPTGNYTYYSHENWQNVSAPLQAGSRTAKPINANAERLLRSVIARAGLSSLTITSTKRDYTDQAYITLTQVSIDEAMRWYPYAAGNQSLFYRYRQELANGRDRETVFREYGDYIRRVAGEGASNHIPGYAIDVTGPGLGRFNAAAAELVPIRGSGVRTIFPETGRSHIEFTFIVV